MHRYTDAEHRFFHEYVYGHSYKEIMEEHNRLFEENITVGQVKSYIGNQGLATGRTGRFEKGNVPYNKGTHLGGYEPTQFKKGNIPVNHKSVGTESLRINKGYPMLYIKVAEPNKWMLKNKYVWEKHHGKAPKGKVIIFLDGDPTNCDISNLQLVDKSVSLIMNRMKLRSEDKSCNETALNIAKLVQCTNEAKKRKCE